MNKAMRDYPIYIDDIMEKIEKNSSYTVETLKSIKSNLKKIMYYCFKKRLNDDELINETNIKKVVEYINSNNIKQNYKIKLANIYIIMLDSLNLDTSLMDQEYEIIKEKYGCQTKKINKICKEVKLQTDYASLINIALDIALKDPSYRQLKKALGGKEKILKKIYKDLSILDTIENAD